MLIDCTLSSSNYVVVDYFHLVIPTFSDCTSDLEFDNITDTMNISCRMFDTCLKMRCCVYVYEIDTTFLAVMDIQPCELTTLVSFENLNIAIPMSEINTGR